MIIKIFVLIKFASSIFDHFYLQTFIVWNVIKISDFCFIFLFIEIIKIRIISLDLFLFLWFCTTKHFFFIFQIYYLSDNIFCLFDAFIFDNKIIRFQPVQVSFLFIKGIWHSEQTILKSFIFFWIWQKIGFNCPSEDGWWNETELEWVKWERWMFYWIPLSTEKNIFDR